MRDELMDTIEQIGHATRNLHGMNATTFEALRRYANDHIQPGGFLTAVLSNDLKEAFGRADDENLVTLFEIVKYCYNELPANCWGSPEKVSKWLAAREEG